MVENSRHQLTVWLTRFWLPAPQVLADHAAGAQPQALGQHGGDIPQFLGHAEGGADVHPQGVHHAADEQEAELHRRALDGQGDADFGDLSGGLPMGTHFQNTEGEGQQPGVAVEVDHAEYHAGQLAQHSGQGGPGHVPSQHCHEQQVQDDVEDGGDADEEQGMPAVPQPPEDGAEHIVQAGEDGAAAADDDVVPGLLVGLRRGVQGGEQRVAQGDAEHPQGDGKADHQVDQALHDLANLLRIPRTEGLGDQHLTRRGEAHADHGDHLHQLAAVGDGGEAAAAQTLADDDGVRGGVQGLQQGADHEGQGKGQQSAGHRAVEQVAPHGGGLGGRFQGLPHFSQGV